MLPLGNTGCNGKTGMAAWGAGMNKNIAWILAILFGGAALWTWYLGRDAAPADPVAIAADDVPETQSTPVQTAPEQPAPKASPTPNAADQTVSAAKADLPESGAESGPETGLETAADADSEQAAVVPVLETARIDADGAVIIAGRAGAGAQVEILVDDAVVETVNADAMGNFVALFDLPDATVARSMTLRVGAGDSVVYAAQDIIIAPSQIKAAKAIPEAAATPQIATADADDASTATQSERQTAVASFAEVSEQGTEQKTEQSTAQSVPEQTVTKQTAPEQTATEQTTTEQSVSEDQTTEQTVTAALDAGQAESASAVQSAMQLAAQSNEQSNALGQGTGQDIAQATGQEAGTDVTSPVQIAENGGGNLQSDPDAVSDQSQTRLSTLDDAGANVAQDDTQLAQLDPAAENTTATPEPSQPQAQPTEPTVFATDDSGVKVLQGGDVLPAGQIVMDAISYDAAGGVVMSGRGQPGAILQFYLNNALTQTAQIDAQGYWAQDMSDVAPGVYTLRLDQLDDAGQVTARFETPFKRENRAALAAAAAQVAQQAADATAAAQEQPTDTGTMATPDPIASQPTAIAPVQAITVQPGNTLWGISRARYGQGILYVRVFDANRDKIRDPDLIYPGQVFVLPATAE